MRPIGATLAAAGAALPATAGLTAPASAATPPTVSSTDSSAPGAVVDLDSAEAAFQSAHNGN